MIGRESIPCAEIKTLIYEDIYPMYVLKVSDERERSWHSVLDSENVE